MGLGREKKKPLRKSSQKNFESTPVNTPKEFHVEYEDNHLIVVNKKNGVLVQGDSTGDMPLSELVKQYLKEKYNKPGNVFVVYYIDDSEKKTEMVEGTIGELSSFHNTFGYYAQGVDLNTSKLPDGWESRLVEICNENTNDVSGLCLEIHDLIVSKLYAGRQKDIEFFRAATNLGLISKGTLTERINKTSISGVRKDMIESYIKKEFSQ